MSNRPQRNRQGDNQEQQVSPIKGKLNNMELFGIGLFVFAFMLYGLSKCFKSPEPERLAVVTEVSDSTNQDTEDASTATSAPLPPRQIDTSSFKQKLYILVDSLRIRKDPQIGGELVGYLRKGEEVTDMGERTAFEKIRVDANNFVTAPWVKVRTKKGTEGWAFAAYMQFYPLPPDPKTTPTTK